MTWRCYLKFNNFRLSFDADIRMKLPTFRFTLRPLRILKSKNSISTLKIFSPLQTSPVSHNSLISHAGKAN